MRAAIEASSNGAKVGMISKSMLGKAHTVMAEGGAAAALANRDHRDSWKIHFRDTMKAESTFQTGGWRRSMHNRLQTE